MCLCPLTDDEAQSAISSWQLSKQSRSPDTPATPVEHVDVLASNPTTFALPQIPWRPWWSAADVGFVQTVDGTEIINEYRNLASGAGVSATISSGRGGDWSVFNLMVRGASRATNAFF